MKDSMCSFLMLEGLWYLTPMAEGKLERETLQSPSRD